MVGSESYPEAVKAFVRMSEPNEALVAYEGRFQMHTEKLTIDGHGRLELRWYPTCHLVADVTTDYSGPLIRNVNGVDATEVNASLEDPYLTRVVESKDGARFEVHSHGIEIGVQDEVDLLTLHIPNLPAMPGAFIRSRDPEETWRWDGRTEFVVHGWRFTLDGLINRREIIDKLKAQGGYALTHTCEMARIDRSPFSYSDAKHALSGLAFLLAVVRGAWSSPPVLVGTRNGTRTWERWDALTRQDAWTASEPWWHPTTRNILPELAEAVFDAVADEDDDALLIAICLYTEANRSELSAETPLVVAHTALDVLAWHVGVRRDGDFTSDTFDGMRAGRRFRHLFEQARLDLAIPSVYSELQAFAEQHELDDIAHAIAFVRDRIVHPRGKLSLEGVSPAVRICASRLAVWAVEMSLLYLFDYQGDYADQHRDSHPPVRVPWSRGEQGGAHPPS